MNIETVNNWLCKHSPTGSTGMREKVGLTVKGTPIASRLTDLVTRKYATVEKQVNPVTLKESNVYIITEAGKKYNKRIMGSSKNRGKIEDIEVINKKIYTVYSSKNSQNKNSIVKQLMGSKAKDAMRGLAELLSADGEARELLKGTAIRLRHQADTIDSFLNTVDEETEQEDTPNE